MVTVERDVAEEGGGLERRAVLPTPVTPVAKESSRCTEQAMATARKLERTRPLGMGRSRPPAPLASSTSTMGASRSSSTRSTMH
jgi:hypothetical protein